MQSSTCFLTLTGYYEYHRNSLLSKHAREAYFIHKLARSSQYLLSLEDQITLTHTHSKEEKLEVYLFSLKNLECVSQIIQMYRKEP